MGRCLPSHLDFLLFFFAWNSLNFRRKWEDCTLFYVNVRTIIMEIVEKRVFQYFCFCSSSQTIWRFGIINDGYWIWNMQSERMNMNKNNRNMTTTTTTTTEREEEWAEKSIHAMNRTSKNDVQYLQTLCRTDKVETLSEHDISFAFCF